MGKSKAEKGAGRKLGRAKLVEAAIKRKREKNKEKRQRQKEKTEEREMLGDSAPPKEVPRTIENTREHDVTYVEPIDEEIMYDESHDTLESYFQKARAPKVLVTISAAARVTTWKFCFELKRCIPNLDVYSRKGVTLKRVVKQAVQKEYTDLIIVNEDRKVPNAVVLCHLPDGPTAHFKLSGLKFTKDIQRHGEVTDHYPEVILNNFSTRLGHSVARMFAGLFPFNPQFRGRRVVTFHNQRDFIFFRHHRYEFKKEGSRAALLELGPRFTLKLRSLQKGTFDSKFGEYEWIHKRHEMETSRRRFFL